MAHQPFENWLLSKEPLPTNQKADLDHHLQTCQECRKLQIGLEEVDRLFTAAEPVAPHPGFSSRWKATAARRKLEQEPRQVRIVFLVLVQAAIISLALLVTIMLIGKVSLAEIIMPAARFFAASLTIGDQVVRWISTNLSAPAGLALWVLVASCICFLVITWVVTVIRFHKRGVQKNETNL